jgi:hypothetical protein
MVGAQLGCAPHRGAARILNMTVDCGTNNGPKPAPPFPWTVFPRREEAGDGAPSQSGDRTSVVRILVLLTLIPASWLGVIRVDQPAIAGVIVLLGGYVLLLTLGPRWLPALRQADLVVVLDILVITAIVLISGMLGSPFLYLYYLAILEAAAQLTLRDALATAVVTATTMIWLWVQAGHAQVLDAPGFRLGALIAGGFFLALLFGTHVQEARTAAALALAYEHAIEGWARALDLRDKETVGHSRRVTEMTLCLARALSVPQGDLVHIREGALLHDIGKMGIPDRILQKNGPLTQEEWDIMLRHPTHAYEFLASVPYLRPVAVIPYCHHEKWDGTGYPRGLLGEDIPLAARIFAVADVWDALRSDRPYRPAWTEEASRAYIREQAGTHFDPRIAEVFLNLDSETASRSVGLAS